MAARAAGHLKLAGLLLAALPAGGCAQRPPERDSDPPAAAVAPPPPCPADQLSCGLQRPVVSDGTAPFANDEFGLRIVFPAGSNVCMTRSGDAPRGFFAIYEGPASCEEPARPLRFVTVNLSWNALDHRTLEEALDGHCPAPSPETLRRIGPRPLAMAGLESRLCEVPRPGGGAELFVHSLFDIDPAARAHSGAPSAMVFAALGTDPAHFDEDLARFRAILATIRFEARR
ncbi:MAG TPA: hypothetical protein VEZ20_05845 [Allosphingosinicella sp.]|nr:hypothetical protein [Allosphingosinicella sp.]